MDKDKINALAEYTDVNPNIIEQDEGTDTFYVPTGVRNEFIDYQVYTEDEAMEVLKSTITNNLNDYIFDILKNLDATDFFEMFCSWGSSGLKVDEDAVVDYAIEREIISFKSIGEEYSYQGRNYVICRF